MEGRVKVLAEHQGEPGAGHAASGAGDAGHELDGTGDAEKLQHAVKNGDCRGCLDAVLQLCPVITRIFHDVSSSCFYIS